MFFSEVLLLNYICLVNRHHTETIEAMQQELDNYENENKELKKKIPKKPFAREISQESNKSPSPASGQPVSTPTSAPNLTDSSIYTQEVKYQIKLNFELKLNSSKCFKDQNGQDYE